MSRRASWWVIAVLAAVLAGVRAAFTASFETGLLERPWPEEYVRRFEVGRHPVRWRHLIADEAVLAGIGFDAPLDRQAVWERSADYHDLGRMTPGVTAVRVLEQSDAREVIQVDVRVLWKDLQLVFEIERDPPRAVRYRLTNELIGEYLGVITFEAPPASGSPGQAPRTHVEIATRLKPAAPVPLWLLLFVERATLIKGVRTFLEDPGQRERDTGQRER